MHNNDQWIQVGWVKNAHGIKGELFIALKAQGSIDWMENFSEFRLSGGTKAPTARKLPQIFTVVKARPHKNGLIIVVEGVADRNAAEELKGASFEIPESLLESPPGERVFLRELLNCRIETQEGTEIGEVVDFSSNGPQDLLVVKNANGRFEIPLVDEFIVELDLENSRLVMNIPEGLVELDHAN